ncbi:hypothetical protein ACRYKS_19790 [Escherichia coli]|uniref:Endonuclease n=3 Tax=root TaxID=1 RepID=A0AAU7PHA2_9CAUD|nr:hypothetical protein [Escherichia coli]MED6536635.1 hypothetical protein [Escherichia coli O157]QAY00297.1 hypothetical protein Ecwhy1_15 [Escherichia phage Ecwhy_1]QXN76482.1 hypothetical protein [Escherichia phage BF17]WGM49736.1 hypothetical protein EcMJ_494 [Escherichia phage vB_Ec-M-J]EGE5776472.1 hypothetical protein [Escherichia coli]
MSVVEKRLVLKNGKMTVKLYKDEADSFMAKAIEKSERYKILAPASKSPYGFNHAHSHFVGMVCEHASFVLFNEIENYSGIALNIDPAFQSDGRDGECDIKVNNLRIEVKGIKYKSWTDFGPCVSTRQLKNIQKKADVILWVLYNEKKQEFTFEGFNYVKDISSIPVVLTGVPGRPMIENHPVLSIIKPLQELPL